MSAIQATVSKFMSLADGTLRIQIDVHQKDTDGALILLCAVGRQVGVAALTEELTATDIANHPPDSEGFRKAQEELIAPIVDKAQEILDKGTEDECDNNAGKLIQKFYQNGFFHATPVLQALGPDSTFLQWCRGQPRCYSCDAEDSERNPIQAAHYRKVAAGAGTGIKPEYSALPLCQKCHLKQHNEGYSAVAPPATWEKWASGARHQWGHERLRQIFSTTSMTAVPMKYVLDWMAEHELSHLVPKEFR